MPENSSRLMLVVFVATSLLVLAVMMFRPGYLSNYSYIGKLIVLELLVLAMWEYRRRFFPLLIAAFLWAGANIPLKGDWTSGRWLVLVLGAVGGLVLYLKDRRFGFGFFHVVALLCGITASISALTSAYAQIALLKTASLALVFLYGCTGARLAIIDREGKFFSGLLLGSEILVYVSAFVYFVLGDPIYGNPNSLGVLMGIGASPILLWGVFISEGTPLSRRRKFAYIVCMLLLLSSYSRASIMAAIVSAIVVCVALRRYRMLVTGLGLVLVGGLLIAATVALPGGRQNDRSSLSDTFLFKGQREQGLLGSRQSPWDRTSGIIQQHPWFGSGFGTSITFHGGGFFAPSDYETPDEIIREHGNSYLAIVEWVGLCGVVPFLVLIILVVVNVGRVMVWMRRTGSPFSPAVPIAGVLLAGIIGAGFEDWMFAAGYYMCVFFWALAFAMVDLLPSPAPAHLPVTIRHPQPQWNALGVPVPGQ